MAGESVTLALGIDASGATTGANEFAAAIAKVQQSARSASAIVDALGKNFSRLPGSIGASNTSIGGFSGAIGKVQQSATGATSSVDRLGKSFSGLPTPVTSASHALGTFSAAAARVDKVSGAGISDIGKGFASLPSSIGSANAALAGFVGGITSAVSSKAIDFLASLAGQVIATGDAYQRLDMRLAMVTGSLAAGTKAHSDLYDMSQRLGVSFESTGGFFARLASQSKELGLSYEQMVEVTQTLEGAFKLGGASAGETSSAMMQLGQAFASGKLQGDEFRSVAENAPVVLDLLSQSLGVTRSELMEMARSGELTSQALSEGLLRIAPQVSEMVQAMGSTVADESQRMMNAWNELLVEFGKTSGVSDAVKQALQGLTAYLESDAGKGAIRSYAAEFGNLISVMTEVIKAGQNVASFLSGLRDQAMSFDKGIRDILGGLSIEKRLGITGAVEKGAAVAGGALNEGIAKLGLGKTADQRAREKIAKSIPAIEELPPVTVDEIIGKRVVYETEADLSFSKTRAAATPKPKVAPRGSSPAFKLGYEAPKSSGGRGSSAPKGKTAEQLAREEESITDRILQSSMRAHDQQIALIEFRRDEELQALASTSMAAEKKAALAVKIEDTAAQQISGIRQKDAEEEQAKQDAALKSLGRYEEANLQVHGRMTDLIIRQRDEEIRAINADKGMTDEQKAQARVLAEDTASQQIIEIRRREAAEIASLQEENLQTRASNAFGDERKQLQKRLLEMQRDSQLADIQASNMSEEMKSQATELKTDTFAQRIAVIDPTPWEAASRNLQEFGENLTSVDGISQGVIQGISSIGSTAASAFADAIVSGESFADTLETLGKTLEKMLIQMTLQMAMQAALGAGASALGAAMGPGAGGTAYSPAEGGGVFGGTAATMAKGGIVQESAGLASGVYAGPTYFPTAEPATRTTGLLAAPSKPNFSYDTAFARGGVPEKTERGLMGEAGPEAVMPLAKTATGQLGVSSRDDEGVSSVLPLRRLPTGQLGVTQPETRVPEPLEPPGYEKALAEGGILADKSGLASTVISRPTLFMVHEPRTYTISAENPTVNFTSPPTTGRSFAKGGVVKTAPEPGIYTMPTRFPTQKGQPQTFAKGGVVESASAVYVRTTASTVQPALPRLYDTAFAKGGVVNSRQAQTVPMATPFARGGVVESDLANRVFTQPTLFAMNEPRTYAKGGVIEQRTEASAPTGPRTTPQSYDTAFAMGGVFERALADRISSMTASAQPSYSQAFAKGGVAESETANRIVTRPTYFPMKEPGLTPMARGRGLMGESGPEAVLPLSRTPTGELGVSASGGGGGGGGNVTITVNNNSKANVSTESSEDGNGNKDIIMTIADQVEGIVASRLSRSGTRVNRAASGVGSVVAR